MPILSLQNVRKEYSTDGQPVRALDAVSLDVEAGQFVALVGRSGCGLCGCGGMRGFMRRLCVEWRMLPGAGKI